MITEQYVTFETARLLKEAGFNCRVKRYFRRPGFSSEPKEMSLLTAMDINREPMSYSCPTQALAARWLREVHGIHVSSGIFMDSANDSDGKTVDEWTFWSFDLFDNSGRIIEESDDRYDTYEEALEAGLKHCLELIKN